MALAELVRLVVFERLFEQGTCLGKRDRSCFAFETIWFPARLIFAYLLQYDFDSGVASQGRKWTQRKKSRPGSFPMMIPW